MNRDDGLALEEGDNRTLRLSVPSLNAESLGKLIEFQRLLIAELRAHPALGHDAFAKAHDDAAAKVGLSRKVINELEAVVRSFCGDRWTVRAMEQRLAQAKAAFAEAEKRGRPPHPRDARALEKFPKELFSKRSTSGLGRRYREDVIALLETRGEELLSLHEELTALLRR